MKSFSLFVLSKRGRKRAVGVAIFDGRLIELRQVEIATFASCVFAHRQQKTGERKEQGDGAKRQKNDDDPNERATAS